MPYSQITKNISRSSCLKYDLLKMVLLFAVGLFGLWGSVQNEPNDDMAEMIRMHIFANSDSVYDQQVKLIVKDAVAEYTADLLTEAETQGETDRILREHLADIDRVADGIAQNYGYNAITQYGRFLFSQRSLDDYVMPSGVYQALRIKLGEGKGHNWFCVLYPEMGLEEYTGSLTEVEAEDDTVQIKLDSFFARCWQKYFAD